MKLDRHVLMKEKYVYLYTDFGNFLLVFIELKYLLVWFQYSVGLLSFWWAEQSET